MPTDCQRFRRRRERRLEGFGSLGGSFLPRVLVDSQGERGGGVSEDGRHDHRMHPAAAELGGDRVTNVVQACGGMHPCLTGKALERGGERVRVQEASVPPIIDQRDGPAEVIDRVVPLLAKFGVTLELLSSVAADPVQGERRDLNGPICPFWS